jgi:hypothetical protein
MGFPCAESPAGQAPDAISGTLGAVQAKKKQTTWSAFHSQGLVDPEYKFGRRDWTRTNDPHHVKVVL